MKFVIETNLATKPAWWRLDDDNRVVAWAGRTYPSLAYADQAAHDFRVNAEDPDYRVHAKTSGRWQWTAWRPEGIRVAVSGDWFTSEAGARAAARRVQQQACTAIGPFPWAASCYVSGSSAVTAWMSPMNTQMRQATPK